eukprot:196749-Alexandrium_andersonii.AAC.1
MRRRQEPGGQDPAGRAAAVETPVHGAIWSDVFWSAEIADAADAPPAPANTYVLPFGLDAPPSPAAMPAPVLAEQQGEPL